MGRRKLTSAENEIAKGFSTTDIPVEFCLVQAETAEALPRGKPVVPARRLEICHTHCNSC
jgi:hypothetical protein